MLSAQQQFRVVRLQEWWDGYGENGLRLPLVDIREREQDKTLTLDDVTPYTTTHTKNTNSSIVSLPFSTLVSGERSCELPPRHVSFAILIDEETQVLSLVHAFFGATTSKATQQSRQPWQVPQVLVANDALWRQARELGLLKMADELVSVLPQPRLWQPDAMVESVLWPLLRERLVDLTRRANLTNGDDDDHMSFEIWDLGSGAGRDVCFLAEQIQLLDRNRSSTEPRHPRRCRVVGLDHHKASAKRCIPFWTHRGVYPDYSDARLMDLRKLDAVQEQVAMMNSNENDANLLCLYAVRFYEPKLIRYLASEKTPIQPNTLFAMSHFCKASKGATWDFDHPKEKSVLERDELATLFGGGSSSSESPCCWEILHDAIASDGDHGRTLIQFVARRL